MDVENGSSGDVERLAEIKARLDAATAGPWATDGPWWWDDDANGEPTCGEMVTTRADRDTVAIMLPQESKLGTGNENANAKFIAHSRADIEYLLALVDMMKDSYPDFGYE